jgi:hypothetical protein
MKPSDCPYKPGTDEWKEWTHDLMRQQHLDPKLYYPAKDLADYRLEKLKENFIKPTILDPDVYYLVHGYELPEEDRAVNLTPFKKQVSRISQINETWAKTEQYVIINQMLAYMPQIDEAPDWVPDKDLYSILILASQKDAEEVRQQNGYFFFAAIQRLTMQQYTAGMNFTVGQVRVKFEKWMR